MWNISNSHKIWQNTLYVYFMNLDKSVPHFLMMCIRSDTLLSTAFHWSWILVCLCGHNIKKIHLASPETWQLMLLLCISILLKVLKGCERGRCVSTSTPGLGGCISFPTMRPQSGLFYNCFFKWCASSTCPPLVYSSVAVRRQKEHKRASYTAQHTAGFWSDWNEWCNLGEIWNC